MLSQFRSAVATTLAGLQEGVNDEDVDMGGAANQAELRDVRRRDAAVGARVRRVPDIRIPSSRWRRCAFASG